MTEIEKGIPLPKQKSGPKPKYPWEKMKVGDSFFVPGRERAKFHPTVWSAGRKTGFRFETRQLDGGVRVWRVE